MEGCGLRVEGRDWRVWNGGILNPALSSPSTQYSDLSGGSVPLLNHGDSVFCPRNLLRKFLTSTAMIQLFETVCCLKSIRLMWTSRGFDASKLSCFHVCVHHSTPAIPTDQGVLLLLCTPKEIPAIRCHGFIFTNTSHQRLSPL